MECKRQGFTNQRIALCVALVVCVTALMAVPAQSVVSVVRPIGPGGAQNGWAIPAASGNSATRLSGPSAVPASQPQTILVKFRPGVQTAQRASVHSALGTVRVHRYHRIPVEVMRIPKGASLQKVIASYKARPEVEYAEPNYVVNALGVPTDPFSIWMWDMHNVGQTGGTSGADISLLAAWDITTGSSSVIVGVIDTGIDYDHPDLAANMWVNPNPTFGDLHGACWNNGDGTVTSGDPMDVYGHGTHVAGTIGAVANNGTGGFGVCPNVRLMALKFLNDYGSGFTADALSAVQYAIDHGANLTSNSWGMSYNNVVGYSQALRDMILSAGAANQLFIAAAGNDSLDNDAYPTYPANYGRAAYCHDNVGCDNMIVVASSDDDDEMSSFSNYGIETVDIAAPGTDIFSTVPNGSSTVISGTSMATPHVSGVVALLLSVHPDATYQDLKDWILQGATQLPQWSTKVGSGGRLNAANSLILSGAPGADLTVAPYDGLVSEGDPGGPFTPSQVVYTLANTSAQSLDWTAAAGDNWVDISPASGTLQANPSSVQVTVSLNANAQSLAAGHYETTVTITDTTAGAAKTRLVTLDVYSDPVIRVKPDGDDSNDGSSWALARQTISSAVNAAVAGREIWVKTGTYVEHSIPLKPGVGIYGGFAGTETQRSQRDWTANPTILDGDGLGNIAMSPPSTVSSVIDGFTIQNGYTCFAGGAMYVGSSNPTVANCTFLANISPQAGGALFVNGGSATITASRFIGNIAPTSGAMYLNNGCNVALTNCSFVANRAYYNDTYNSGTIAVGIVDRSTIAVDNCTLAANRPQIVGGGFGFIDTTSSTITNCVMADAEDYLWDTHHPSSAAISYCCFPTNYSHTDWLQPGTGDILADPLFVSPPSPGPSGQWEDGDDYFGDLRLQAGSPCIDAADNGAVPAGVTTDLAGNPRFVDDPNVTDTGAGTAPIADMGAYEGASATTQAAEPQFSLASGTYTGQQSVTVNCLTSGATIHYTTNGADPTTGDPSVAPGGSVTVDHDLTLKAAAWASGLQPSTVASATYQIITPAPVFSPDGGVYQSQQQVTITCADAAATIHYTTNGADPTTSDAVIQSGQSVVVSVSPATLLKAKAWDAACYAPSAIKVALYRNSANHIVVSPSGSDTNDGLSWSTPKLTIQAAIDTAVSGDEVWVKAGTYNDAVTLKNGVSVYGGFAGTETARTQRSAVANVTTIDYLGSGSAVTAPSTVGTTTVFDGFTVTSSVSVEQHATGFSCSGQPVISNNTFTGWNTEYQGNGYSVVVLQASSGLPTFQYNRVENGNYVPVNLWRSSAKIIGNYIGHNTGKFGGIWAWVIGSSGVIADNVIVDNGGNYSSCGGIYVYSGSIAITNNTVVGNRVMGYGLAAGIGVYDGTSTIKNNIVAFNTVHDDTMAGIGYAGGIGVASPGAVVDYNDVYGNTSSDPQYSNYYGVSPGAHDTSVDPGFWDRSSEDYRLTYGSDCIDAGLNTATGIPTYDADGKTRILDGDSDATATADIGAYEYRRFCAATTGNNANDGSTWGLAKLTVAGALASAAKGDEVWVAQGSYSESGLQLADCVKLLGGFDGSGATRDWNTYTTTLNGPQYPAMTPIVTTAQHSTTATLVEGFTMTGIGYSCPGACTANGAAVVRYNTFADCVGLQGPAAMIATESASILNNVFSGGYSYTMGGGMIVGGSCKVVNNTFSENSAYVHGGAIYIGSGSPVIANNIITGGTTGCGIYKYASATPTVSHNNVYGNSPNNYDGLSAGTGDISSDPGFTDAWHIASNSPCIDAGDDDATGLSLLYTDMDGQIRTDGLHVDIGADEVVTTSAATVTSTSPANSATDVALHDDISATFSAAMMPSTITTATFVLSDGSNPVVGSVTYDTGTNTATFTPADGLAATTTYTATITTGVKDANGRNLAGSYSWSFTTASQPTHYMVKSNAPGPVHDGTSWNNAFLTITDALDASRATDELWVAAGTYSEGITLKNAVGVYGGFAGTESARSSRNSAANVTTLSYDGSSAAVTAPQYTGAATVFDGFTVTTTAPSAGGSGFFCFGEPVISGNTFTGWNGEADTYAVYICSSGHPVVQSNRIVYNTASPVCLVKGSAQIIGNYIAYNTGFIGGIDVEQNTGGTEPLNDDTLIANNLIAENGTEDSAVGGIFCNNYSRPVITNNTVVGNQVGTSGLGAGICVTVGDFTITNNIVAYNTAVNGGGGIDISAHGSSTVVDYNDVYGNTSGAAQYNNYYGVSPGAHDISVDPGFWDRNAGDYHLTYGSGCIDAGNNSATGIGSYDKDGKTRILDGNYDATATIDIGAYEYRRFCLSTGGNDSNDGSSWNLAKLTLAGAFAAATSGDEIWVASGTYSVSGQVLTDGMKLLGGFSGSGSTRSWSQYVTTLNSTGSPVSTSAASTASTLFEGFTVTGYSMTSGGGCLLSGGPTVRYNVFNGCHGAYGGGAICSSGPARIINNVFYGNSSGVGGAIVSSGSPIIVSNTFKSNYANGPGGGIYVASGSPVIANNIITGTASGYGIYCGNTATPTLSHNDLYSNSPANYYGVSAGTGDISADPLITGLWTISDTSPCVDAGDNSAPALSALDIDGQDRVYNDQVDMGADEYQP